MSMNIGDVSGLLSELEALNKATPAEIQAELDTAAQNVLASAQDAAPVLTGEMRDSGHADSGNLESTVTFDADYALFVEMGHLSRAGNPVPPQHFLLPAFYDEANALQARLEDKTS